MLATEQQLKDGWKELVEGVLGLEPFPFESFTQRLHNKARYCFGEGGGYTNELRPYIATKPRYPEGDRDFENPFMLEYEIHDLFDKLAIPAAALAVGSADNNTKDLKACINSDNSKQRYIETLTNLMGFCLGEHINFQLIKQGKRGLIELYQMEGFKEYALKQIISPSFINLDIRTDSAKSDHLFSISFLMLADFFDNREFAFRSAPSIGPGFKNKASYKTLNQWSRTLWFSGGKESAEEMDKIVQFCGRVATIGLVPPHETTGLQHPAPVSKTMNLFYRMDPGDLQDHRYSKDLQDSLDRLEDKEEIINEWKSYCSILSKTWELSFQSIWNTAFFRALQDGKVEQVKYWATHSWDTQSRFLKWDKYLPVIKDPYYNSYQLSTGFPSGSKITLDDGTKKPVETISEKDQILTHGLSKISVPVQRQLIPKPLTTRLIGFNGEKPAIPSSQVFLTPMGLRAVDLDAAKKQNPYQHIGVLAIGHTVYRLQKGEYQAVEIQRIEQSEETTFDLVHTLTLPDGKTSLHLDGYLVDINSPTQTLGQTIETMRKVPGSRRLDVLSHLPELQSILQRFDSRCVSHRLNKELFGEYNSPDGQEPNGCHGGKRTSFSDHFDTSHILSSKAGVSVDRLTRRFCLTADDPTGVPNGYELPDLTLVDGYLLPPNGEKLRSRYNPQDRTIRWTRDLQDRREFEHGVIEIYPEGISGTGVIFLSLDSEANAIPTHDQLHTFKASVGDLLGQTKHDGPNASASDNQSTWRGFGTYKITLDQSVWPPNTERSQAEHPIDGGEVIQGAWKNPNRPDVPGLRFPLAERIRNQINQKYKQPLGDFHKITSRYAGISHTELEYSTVFRCASLIPFISDCGLDVQKTFNVKLHPDLGVDVTLPALYQQMRITFDPEYNGFTGYFYEYDPTKRGCKGNRHFIKGAAKDSEAVAFYRSKASKYYSSVSNPGDSILISEKKEPAPVTMYLLNGQKCSLKDLQQFTTYDEKQLHNTTQNLIHKMMLYHMDRTQREKILRQAKPLVNRELPAVLADNLQQNLKTFFKDKYAPAFICRYVGRTPKYLSCFTDKEIKKLWYWWEGNGKKSLSQSSEYNDINLMASRGAMRSLYASKLEPYLNDHPEKWAEDLHNDVIQNTRMLGNWSSNPIQGGNNLVNKQCNILDALSNSKNWGQKFFENFMAIAVEESSDCPWISEDSDKVRRWIHDSMRDQIIAILSGDDKMSAEVRAALAKDIAEFEEENNLNSTLDAKQRAAAILEKTSLLLGELSGWMSSIGKGLQAAFSGTALFTWFGKAFDKIVAKISPSLKAVKVLKGIGVVSMVSVSILTVAVNVWQLVNDWENMSDAQRSTVIIETLRMVIEATDHAFDSFKSFKSNPTSSVSDAVNARVLDDSISETIGQRAETMGTIAENIVGEHSDYRVVIGEGLHGESGVPVPGATTEPWNEELSNPAKEVPPGYEKVPEKLNISGKVLRVLNSLLGIGLVVSMSFSLAHEWKSLTNAGKILGVLNVVVQGLIVLLDILTVGADIGLFAITETMSVVLPIAGAVLAVIGMVLMIVQLFVNFYSARQKPQDPIEDFIRDVAHKLIDAFDPSPEPELAYTISHTDVCAGKNMTITITGKNMSSKTVTLSHTRITLYTGDDDVCLFNSTEPYIELVGDDEQDKDKDGHTYVTTSDLSGADLPTPAKLGNESKYYQYELKAAGPPQDFTTSLKNLVLEKGQMFKSVWTAGINKKGKDKDSSTSWIELVEVGLVDKCVEQFTLHRI